jgi:2-polyprenyl-3-methyl-5-hydroxy-6-metoxy-1,4-benzoquinol methylase
MLQFLAGDADWLNGRIPKFAGQQSDVMQLRHARQHRRPEGTTVKTHDSGMPVGKLWATFLAGCQGTRNARAECDASNAVDFGCGCGIVTVPAAKVALETVYALDLDPAMVTATKTKAEAKGVRNLGNHQRYSCFLVHTSNRENLLYALLLPVARFAV